MKALALCLLVACGAPISQVWPVSPEIAQSSSFAFNGGTAFVVDEHHALTAGSLCGTQERLCLVSGTYTAHPLIFADNTPHGWRKLIRTTGTIGAPVVATWHEQDPWGDPLTWRSGVVGLVLAPGRYAGLAEITAFLSAHDVNWHDEPRLPGPYKYSEDQMYQR